ncbi:hypothetical protein ACFVAJ_16830 [Agromyces sp. NPDC057679]|uniref:hypothetical protein n=1 Tax=Agromyces sp. NPDC057679 TaxID=3346207 RepID=UPI00366FC8FC
MKTANERADTTKSLRDRPGARRRVAIISVTAVACIAAAACWFAMQPSAAERERLRTSEANSADDWSRLPKDASGSPIGEPPINPDVEPGGASEMRTYLQPLPHARVEDGIDIIDSTETTSPVLGSLVGKIGQPVPLFTSPSCFTEWAVAELATSDTQAGMKVVDVCDQPSIVVIGGYSVSPHDLYGLAYLDPAPKADATRSMIDEASAFDYASAATADGRGVILVLSPRHE